MSSADRVKIVPLAREQRRREPLITGQLQAFPIANVLQFLGSSRVTGTLALRFGERRAYVCLEEGMIVAASTSRAPRRTRDKAQMRIDREKAEEALLARACEVLSLAMAWPHGQFSFSVSDDAIEPVLGGDRPRLEAERVLMQTVFSIDEELRVG